MAASQDLHEARDRGREMIGITLMTSADTEAAVELIREEQPDARVRFRDVSYKIEREGVPRVPTWTRSLSTSGASIDTDIFLVSMSSYYGRIVVSDGKVEHLLGIVRPDSRTERSAMAPTPTEAAREDQDLRLGVHRRRPNA